jgi:hypothetical protein
LFVITTNIRWILVAFRVFYSERYWAVLIQPAESEVAPQSLTALLPSSASELLPVLNSRVSFAKTNGVLTLRYIRVLADDIGDPDSDASNTLRRLLGEDFVDTLHNGEAGRRDYRFDVAEYDIIGDISLDPAYAQTLLDAEHVRRDLRAV